MDRPMLECAGAADTPGTSHLYALLVAFFVHRGEFVEVRCYEGLNMVISSIITESKRGATSLSGLQSQSSPIPCSFPLRLFTRFCAFEVARFSHWKRSHLHVSIGR